MSGTRATTALLAVAFAICGSGCGSNSPTGPSEAQYYLKLSGPSTDHPYTVGEPLPFSFSMGATVDAARNGRPGTIEEDWRFVFTKGGAYSWELTKANMQAVLGSGLSYYFAASITWPSAGHIDVKASGLPADFRVTHPCDAVQATVHVRDEQGNRHELSATGSAQFY